MHDGKSEKEKNYQIHIVIGYFFNKYKDIEKFKTSSNDLIAIFRTLYPVIAEYTLKTTWEITKLDYVLDHKINLSDFKNIRICRACPQTKIGNKMCLSFHFCSYCIILERKKYLRLALGCPLLDHFWF